MSYCILSDKVWWGDRASPQETKGKVKSIISLLHNLEMLEKPHRSPYQILPHHVPFFWLGRPDEVPIDDSYMDILDSTCQTIVRNNLFPVLVHCYAGQHRSTATALYLQLMISGFTQANYEDFANLQYELNPYIHIREFADSLHTRIQKKLS